ncbi:glycoside hydrolase family 5 protein [Yoonia sp. BS5-3]|uniref:Glycoside hydrolase family 5 protein n=1 Tax=Yoonia phaeophyticola TaxID=3137369 RepID=A0ABZ2V3U9_9RHOB
MRAIFLCLLVAPAWAQPFPVQRCVNLDQALEAPREGDWGYRIERGDIAWIADQGFNTIRLPVRFNAHWDGALSPQILARVDEVISWAAAEDLSVILDLHHFEALMRDPPGQAEKFAAIWTELATHYAGYDDRLIFELLNEPSEALATDEAMRLFEAVLPTIRASNPDRWVIIEGGDWASVEALADLHQPDARTALSFHYYVPWEFTHQMAPWMDAPPPPGRWGDKDDREILRRDMALAGSYDAPVLLGEFGVTTPTDPSQRARWTKAVREEADAHGIGWCHWGLAGNFAILDKTTQTWVPRMKDALISGH